MKKVLFVITALFVGVGLSVAIPTALSGDWVGTLLGFLIISGALAAAALGRAVLQLTARMSAVAQALEDIRRRLECISPTATRTEIGSPDKPSAQSMDLAAIGRGDPSLLAAARLDRDVFPRLVTTMEQQPPAEAAEAQPGKTHTSFPAAGFPDDHTADERTAGADTTAATIKNLLREWEAALRNGDLAACRAVFSALVDMADMATVITMRQQLVELADRAERSLRETFRRYFHERNYTGMLTIGEQICRLLPDRPVAGDFKRIRPYLLRRREHASDGATTPTLRVIP
ncbi:MAG: hypothetical protein JSU86_11750 [Phycisphaerales bacterium]|nr:MAG: hypothetical protein JSU86_11750 [Phycisphaerales bacterium]